MSAAAEHDTGTAILTAAARLFGERGYKGTTTRAIAEEAGIYVHPTDPDHWEGAAPFARGDRIADDRVLAALENFWRLLAKRYQGRGVIFAYDLLNEPDEATVAGVIAHEMGHQLAHHTALQWSQIFKEALGRSYKVEIVESFRRGGNQCHLVVHLT